MANVASLTVSTVAANVASSNREIRDAASQALDHLIQLVGMSSAVIHPTSPCITPFNVYMGKMRKFNLYICKVTFWHILPHLTLVPATTFLRRSPATGG